MTERHPSDVGSLGRRYAWSPWSFWQQKKLTANQKIAQDVEAHEKQQLQLNCEHSPVPWPYMSSMASGPSPFTWRNNTDMDYYPRYPYFAQFYPDMDNDHNSTLRAYSSKKSAYTLGNSYKTYGDSSYVTDDYEEDNPCSCNWHWRLVCLLLFILFGILVAVVATVVVTAHILSQDADPGKCELFHSMVVMNKTQHRHRMDERKFQLKFCERIGDVFRSRDGIGPRFCECSADVVRYNGMETSIAYQLGYKRLTEETFSKVKVAEKLDTIIKGTVNKTLWYGHVLIIAHPFSYIQVSPIDSITGAPSTIHPDNVTSSSLPTTPGSTRPGTRPELWPHPTMLTPAIPAVTQAPQPPFVPGSRDFSKPWNIRKSTTESPVQDLWANMPDNAWGPGGSVGVGIPSDVAYLKPTWPVTTSRPPWRWADETTTQSPWVHQQPFQTTESVWNVWQQHPTAH